PCVRLRPRLPSGRARAPGRSRSWLSEDARPRGRGECACRPRGSPTDVPRLDAGRIPLLCPRRARHQPARPGRADGRARRAPDGDAVARDPVRRRDLPSAFHARAPVRLDFAGGWTDVPPFSAREGGVVVNAAIALSAHVELTLGGPRIKLAALDLGEELECANAGGLVIDGRLDLHKAALRMFPVQSACTVALRSGAPACSRPTSVGRRGSWMRCVVSRRRLST